jgi:hypothetical protein
VGWCDITVGCTLPAEEFGWQRTPSTSNAESSVSEGEHAEGLDVWQPLDRASANRTDSAARTAGWHR